MLEHASYNSALRNLNFEVDFDFGDAVRPTPLNSKLQAGPRNNFSLDLDKNLSQEDFLTLDTSLSASQYSLALPSKPTSAYWRVPDAAQYLSAVAVHPMDRLCAVASGNRENNLFIYELGTSGGDPILTHHQTITLPHIHSLQWVSPSTPLGSHGNVLVSGHKNGLVHMTLLPDAHSSDIPAEILKRFNHQHHISSNHNTRIRQLGLTSLEWSCSVPSSIATLCADNFFLWNPTRSDVPLLKQRARGVASFDLCDHRDGVLVMGGRKGISIRDIRANGSSGLSPPNDNTGHVSVVRWSPTDENTVAAVHDGNVIKIWDVRSSGPLCTYTGHMGKVTSVEWSPQDPSQLVSSSYDGTIKVWSMNQTDANEKNAETPRSNKPAPNWSGNKSFNRYQQRQQDGFEMNMLAMDIMNNASSLAMVSQNKEFVAMRLSGDDAVSIDSEGCFGFHRLNTTPMTPISSASDSSDNDFMPPTGSY